ncbi:hypothetical protein DUI87_30623 [Hirundo rustica rustica]|uniref:Uncharacterized protein n=1 Tax=Hirundo rustica rustica TaxID=333673 RepID=A0A3M0IWD3_HIRRU|nr:hypothetical protein DUI87_30623 [Hirundo rustica rustica]
MGTRQQGVVLRTRPQPRPPVQPSLWQGRGGGVEHAAERGLGVPGHPPSVPWHSAAGSSQAGPGHAAEWGQGVLSAFAGAVIDGDTVSLVERKYSHYCLLQPSGAARPQSRPAAPNGTAAALRCQKLRDYQQGLVLSTVFNALECLLGLLNLLLVKNYKAAQQRGRRRRRRRAALAAAAAAGGRRRRRRGGGGGRRAPRHSQGSLFSGGEPELSPGDCPFQAVSYINVGVFHVFDEAGVEVHCGGHPSVELPG